MEELEIPDQMMNGELIPMETQLFDIQLIDDAEIQLDILEPHNAEEEMPPQISEAQPTRCRKRKSEVWKYFTVVEDVTKDDDADGSSNSVVDESSNPVVDGSKNAAVEKSSKAVCNCGKSYAYSKGCKVNGTSHLKRHITCGKCPFVLNNQEETQLSPSTAPPRMVTNSNTLRRRCRRTAKVSFDADRCRSEISQLIIMHDYPLHMVEHPVFVSFVQNLQPRFDMVSFNNVQEDCIATYLEQKQEIQKVIESMPGQICLTLDLWSSSRTIGYLFVTGQFIDSEWKIHRKLLNVITEPYPDSDTAFSHSVAASLSDWNMDGKLFSVTIDQHLSDPAVANLRSLMSVKNPLMLNGQLLVGNCLARSLSDIVQTALTFAHDIVKKVRDCVKYVKTSESREERFQELKQQLQVLSLKSLSIDDKTKWDTTYEMLLSALELKEVFSCLDDSDPDYKNGPSSEDWKQIEVLCSYLKLLFDTANLLTTATTQTTNKFFHEAWKIQLELALAVSSEDPFVSALTKSMQVEFEKYWKSCCFVLAIGVVMDPRFKMKLVDFIFSKVYGEKGAEYAKVVNDGINELFLDYVAVLPLPEEANGMVVKEDDQEGISCNGAGFMEFDEFIMETMNQISRTELDEYLEESLLPRGQELDVIGWWKENRMKYPILSKMARDILSIPVCSMPAASSVFDTVRKEMDRYRCELRPETLEALICAKEWLQSETPV